MVSSSGMDGENLDGESGSAWACRHPPFQITSHAWYYGPPRLHNPKQEQASTKETAAMGPDCRVTFPLYGSTVGPPGRPGT